MVGACFLAGSFFCTFVTNEMQAIPEVYQIAIEATIAASKEILCIYELGFETNIKHDGSPVTEADLAASKIISSILEKTGIPIIGEERDKLPFETRKLWKENWCVDPLDGTKEFIKRNGEFCVNIAHIENEKPVFGIINEPCKGRIIFGGKETGVFLWDYLISSDLSTAEEITNDFKLESAVTWIGSRSHESADAKWVEELSKTFQTVKKIPKGSAIKFFDLAIGNAQIYPRYAPTMEWDIAAGQAILEALGGCVLSAETGLPLSYNKESLYNPHFVAKTASFLAHEAEIKSTLE